jgi:nitroreductase
MEENLRFESQRLFSIVVLPMHFALYPQRGYGHELNSHRTQSCKHACLFMNFAVLNRYKFNGREDTVMTFEEMARARYSVKKFSDKPVEEEKLSKVLEVANLAPTAKNAQSARIYVLRSEEAMDKAKELTPCIYGAPLVLMFAYNRKEAFRYPDEKEIYSGDEDCSIVATHVMFEAKEQGLDTCWVNFFSPTKAKAAFQLPEEEEVVLLMPIGYAAESTTPLPNHSVKKALSEVVREL